MFAVANTVLINYIMGSRLLYGMARQGLVPRFLGQIHAGRRTPHRAIFTLLCIVIVLVLVANVKELAAATGLLLLMSFMVVNGALLVLKRRKNEPRGHFEVPSIVPLLGIVVNGVLVASKLIDEFRARRSSALHGLSAPIIAGLMILAIAILYLVIRPRNISEETLAAAEAD
jgi:amino acid transporter